MRLYLCAFVFPIYKLHMLHVGELTYWSLNWSLVGLHVGLYVGCYEHGGSRPSHCCRWRITGTRRWASLLYSRRRL